ncbi:potassium uptake protein [Desulfocucumis palustris]|uniref:Potassium uptake protein n=1 Tax=Desulfocucumis palustris TaxID=1898651 RepID=A0A2L2XFK0_9FIRM|nr:TrkH family potassium uptake protein [Desulfocucumis palustris]GBF34940.1 potassium uptake protein [Desulfocucumis palustris]
MPSFEQLQRKSVFKKAISLTPPQLLVLGFALTILTGAVVLTLPGCSAGGEYTDFITALFTSTSAVCVTGLVVVDTGTYWSPVGQLVILLLIQIGGLGFMTMATFFNMLMGKKIGLRNRLILQESLNQNSLQGVVRLSKYVLIITFLLELFFAVILAVRLGADLGYPRALWFGIFHSISAFNNAGFDIFGNFSSITGYVNDTVVTMSVATLIILGGIGFGVIIDILNYRHRKMLFTHTKLVLWTSGILIAVGAVFIYFFEMDNTLKGLTPWGKCLASFFQSVTPRTAGFNTIDISHLHSYTLFFIIILMFIGASPGSTGGGIKTSTFALLGLSVLSLTRGKSNTQLFKRTITQDQVIKALAVLLLAILLIVVVSIALMAVEREENFLLVLFETVSAFGTVGLSMGLTPELSPAGRLLIIMTMFLGRVGTITAVFALTQRTKRREKIKYPEDKVMVG